ncbi:MAG: DUF4416 family protein [Leptospirales bacterium]|nr:DUF4416 family protein [Leptospirales bacterium]
MARAWKAPLSEPPAARAFVIAAFDDLALFQQARAQAERRLGKIDYETGNLPAELRHSQYGLPNRRLARLLSFRRPVGREELVDLCRRSVALEARLQSNGAPLVELDCGYVTLYQTVRAATSEDFHRVYLYDGIYAEAALYFEKLSFRPFLYTSAFFRQQELIAAFNDVRLIIMAAGK